MMSDSAAFPAPPSTSMMTCPPTTASVVTRCIPLEAREVIVLLAGIEVPLDTGRFIVDRRFQPGPPLMGCATGRSTAWLITVHHRPTWLTLEVSPWTFDVTEIVLRVEPASLKRWGVRHRRRYFAAAHQAAEGLLGQLMTSTTSRHVGRARPRGGAFGNARSDACWADPSAGDCHPLLRARDRSGRR